MNYDLSKLNELSGGDVEFNTSVIETFLTETPSDLSNLEQAAKGKAFDQVYQFAHKIKPNADLLGINKVRDQMLEIERHARGDYDIEAISALITAAEKELQDAFAAFKDYIG
ncbi:Hpt domain-containing protein [Galbibacter sp. EGI 63066]|uniref:Hpt domain-containing protein n=1 Tax=Galbibacter sp. EGI 63066 TaxID=2993559 RepID=UPI002248DAB3|nr:Hpt domain-containing protein [Galbibacter sp. EGI 63066]MCX2681591.1 Hpt domain-containing protein [Galbibacter sp. EGI 63066]